MVKALDLSSNGRVVRVGSNPTPGKNSPFNGRVVTSRLSMQRTEYCIHDSIQCFWILSRAKNILHTSFTDPMYASRIFACVSLESFFKGGKHKIFSDPNNIWPCIFCWTFFSLPKVGSLSRKWHGIPDFAYCRVLDVTLAIFANICVSENKGSLNLHKVLKRECKLYRTWPGWPSG